MNSLVLETENVEIQIILTANYKSPLSKSAKGFICGIITVEEALRLKA